ncbi:MAG: hypothetical protein EAZ99_04990 [Alphaproteobacteria bacterium]|nr:hypothetical protein [Alphaproteobacteria bacterium]TAD90893.1 MAG: hypothetical protein EAZ99_04990 [Alphaproteobacteria bacterium]
MMQTGLAPRHVWAIEGSYRDLAVAAAEAGLDRNAVRYASDTVQPAPLAEGRLDLPSPWCETPAPWLATLAVLADRGLSFRLTLTETNADGRVSAFAKLFPRFDASLRDLLAAVHPRAAADLDRRSRAVEAALDQLRRALSQG